MKKFLVTSLILLIIAVLGSKACVALFSYQILDAFQRHIDDTASFNYKWLSSNFDGIVSIHEVAFRPYPLKRTFYVERIDVAYSDYISLLMGLLNLKEGRWEDAESISLTGFRAPLEGRRLTEWLALDYGRELVKPITLQSCDSEVVAGPQLLNEMGISEISGDISLDLDSMESGNTRISTSFDLAELGKSEIALTMQDLPRAKSLADLTVNDLNLVELNFSHIERGYFRRLSNFCTQADSQDRDQFSRAAAEGWRQSMSYLGLDMNADLASVYAEYLALGGKIELALKPKKVLALSNLKSLIGKDWIDALGMSLSLNGQPAKNLALYLDRRYFDPEPVAKPEPEEDLSEPEENIVVEKSFKDTAWEELSEHIGHNVRVKLLEGKEYEGALVSHTEFVIEVSKRVNGGELKYKFRKLDVEFLQVWR